jgi:hypothetical protein
VSSVSGSELTGSSGTRYSPSAHLARSSSWQRWLQNGRQAGSIGRWRQYTQTAPALGGIRPFYLAHAGRSKGGQTGSATTASSAGVPGAAVQGSSATVPQFRAAVVAVCLQPAGRWRRAYVVRRAGASAPAFRGVWTPANQFRWRSGSGAWCRTSRADTMKMTSSAMLVAWSPIRSRWRDTRIRSSAGSMVAGSWSM